MPLGLNDVVRAHRQHVFQRQCIAQIDDRIDVRQALALGDAREHRFDRAHELVGVDAERLERGAVGEDGEIVLDLFAFKARGCGGDGFVEACGDNRIFGPVVHAVGGDGAEADAGEFFKDLRSDGEFHGFDLLKMIS